MTDAISKSLGTLAQERPRWRSALTFDGTLGPPPKLARAARLTYLATAVVMGLMWITAMVFGALSGPGQRSHEPFHLHRDSSWFWGAAGLGLIAVYAYGLSRGVARLASPTVSREGEAACALLLVHGLAGLSGSLALAAGPFIGSSSPFHVVVEVCAGAAAIGLVFGSALALPAVIGLRRGALLMIVALSGPVILIALIALW